MGEPGDAPQAGKPRLPILHQDRQLVIVDKPAGLASVPSPGVSGRTCLAELRASHPEVLAVHRLDRETSGVLVFARSEQVRAALESLFRTRSVEKKYTCLVRGAPRPASGTIRKPIEDRGHTAAVSRRGRPAVTHYRTVRRLGPVTLLEVTLETGRYNQIRVHFAALGHPLVGERKYARGRESPVRFRRVALHARSIAFPHPDTGRPLKVGAPLAEDLRGLIEQLEARR